MRLHDKWVCEVRIFHAVAMADTANRVAMVGNTLTTMADLCKTDLQRIIKYLDDAATLYDQQHGLRYSSRAWCIRKLLVKLNNKLSSINHDKK